MVPRLMFSNNLGEAKGDTVFEMPFVESKRPEILVKKRPHLNKLIKIPKVQIP